MEKSIKKASVMAAYRMVRQLGGEVTGLKQLGVFGASYVWPVFVKMGLIKDERMKECPNGHNVSICDSKRQKRNNLFRISY